MSTKGKSAKPSARSDPVAAPSSVLSFSGQDSLGNQFSSVNALWEEVLDKGLLEDKKQEENNETSNDNESSSRKRARFYRHGAAYWENVEASYDGVLGGFGHLSPVDIEASKEFLSSLPGIQYDRAIDCGAGVGRVAENLLCPAFSHVDLVEQNAAYVEKARESIKHKAMKGFFTCGLQDFDFEPCTYDIIWIQWVISQLTDDDCVKFLIRCQAGLKENGLICLKENNTGKDGFVLDRDDGSVTRSNALFKVLFQRAGLKLIKEKVQPKFPKQLFPVRMYALAKKTE